MVKKEEYNKIILRVSLLVALAGFLYNLFILKQFHLSLLLNGGLTFIISAGVILMFLFLFRIDIRGKNTKKTFMIDGWISLGFALILFGLQSLSYSYGALLPSVLIFRFTTMFISLKIVRGIWNK